MKISYEIASTNKDEWRIFDLINWLNEQKDKGASEIHLNWDYEGGVEVQVLGEREETEQERWHRENPIDLRVKMKYEPKTYK